MTYNHPYVCMFFFVKVKEVRDIKTRATTGLVSGQFHTPGENRRVWHFPQPLYATQ